jgi:hypothetical protein
MLINSYEDMRAANDDRKIRDSTACAQSFVLISHIQLLG